MTVRSGQSSSGERVELLRLKSRVSRLLTSAVEAGVVRTVVVSPEGIYGTLEDDLERRFGLKEARVVDIASRDEADILRGLGAAAAAYLYDVQPAAPTVGFGSWSRGLREMVAALPPIRQCGTTRVVELIGDIGSPITQHDAAQATQDLASRLGAQPVFIRVPGVVASPELGRSLVAQDPYLREALGMLDHLDLAITGIGPVNVSAVLWGQGNFFSDAQLEEVTALGAVGQLNLRYLDRDGRAIASPLDELVVGVTLEQLRRAPRSLLVAGGSEKVPIIRAALRGGWVNMLITDLGTAEQLVADATEPQM